jgi:hypothetical protein
MVVARVVSGIGRNHNQKHQNNMHEYSSTTDNLAENRRVIINGETRIAPSPFHARSKPTQENPPGSGGTSTGI